MRDDMLKLHLCDLPVQHRKELFDWIFKTFKDASTWSENTNYRLKQQFVFSDPAQYHITEKIFHEAMIGAGFKSKPVVGKPGKFVYKAAYISKPERPIY